MASVNSLSTFFKFLNYPPLSYIMTLLPFKDNMGSDIDEISNSNLLKITLEVS